MAEKSAVPIQLTLFGSPPDFAEPAPIPTACPLAVPGLTARPIVLLDLNYTLVGNSPLKRRQRGLSYHAKILTETYRSWLIDLLRGYQVILWTVRFEQYREVTLARIQQLENWGPDRAIFNPTGSYEAHEVKEGYLNDTILPTYGSPRQQSYIALESNQRTRAMLTRYGIPAVKVGPDDHWYSLPGHNLPAYQREQKQDDPGKPDSHNDTPSR
jgi:hypothetical protein